MCSFHVVDPAGEAAPTDVGTAGHGRTTAADGLALDYAVRGGGGPTLILVHGWSCSQDFWRFQLQPLAERFRVVTLDLAGHGRSPAAPEARAWSMAAHAGDVMAVADAVGAERFALVGHSMGGAVAIEAALLAGPRCRLVLGVDTFEDAAFYGACRPAEIAARLRRFEAGFAAALQAMVTRITAPRTDRAVVAEIADGMARNDPALALRVLGALLAWDIGPRWPQLACPVETINSALLAPGIERLALDGLVVHAMAGVGHFPMMEDPAAFNALALSILERRLLP